METTCKNCLNAYKTVDKGIIVCTNKMWYYKMNIEKSKVTPFESCDSYTKRKLYQEN